MKDELLITFRIAGKAAENFHKYGHVSITADDIYECACYDYHANKLNIKISSDYDGAGADSVVIEKVVNKREL